MINKELKEQLQADIDREGFDYLFVYYSDFRDVIDKKFHELRRDYLNARKALADYLDVD